MSDRRESPTSPDIERFARREARRSNLRATASVILGYAVAVVTLLAIGATGVDVNAWWGPALLLVAVLTAPLIVAIQWLLLRRRLWPGLRAIRWTIGNARAAWLELDGGLPPAEFEEVVVRLSGRNDDNAISMRLGWLVATGRSADLRNELESWSPTTSVGVAQRTRLTSKLAVLDGVIDHLERAWEAASAVPDAGDRVEQQARVFIEAAWRRMDADEDPFPWLVEARGVLGDRASEFDTEEDRRAHRRVQRFLAASGLVPAVVMAILAVAALSGLFG